MTKTLTLLVSIIIISVFLRFYKLGQVPLSLNWDEVSNGYNAYSILKTGRDEYGNFLPLTNRSFDDYKPPLYMYLNVATVKLFGLSPLAVRFPSAFFGTLTVLSVYFLTKKLSQMFLPQNEQKLSLISAFFVAISPWHIQLSRAGFEATVGLFLIVSAVTMLLYSERFKYLYVPSALFSGFALYAYHAQRIFAPLLVIATLAIFAKHLKTKKNNLAIFIAVFLIVLIPFFVLTPKQAILQRLESSSQEGRKDDIDKSIRFIETDNQKGLTSFSLMHNRRVIFALNYLNNYLSHFDFNFLFTKGDNNPRHHVENMGMLYFSHLPLLLLGTYLLVLRNAPASWFILIWFVLSPLAAAPVSPAPHAIRSFQTTVAADITAALGILAILQYRKKIFRLFLSSFFLFWIPFLLFFYLHEYYVHDSIKHAASWQYGYVQAAKETESLKNNFEKVVVDGFIEQGYIFWLFATSYDPLLYQKEGSRTHFDKYYFNSEKPNSPNTLYVSYATQFNGSFTVLSTIYYPDGKEAIKIGYPKQSD